MAFLITSPLPMWSGITDGGWGFLLGGVLLYLLRERRVLQVTVWAVNSFLWDFVWLWMMLRSQPGFAPVQMLTTYYEWMEIGAVVLMLLYNGQRGSGHKAFSTGSTRPMYICCMVCPALCITLGSKEGDPYASYSCSGR